ncbi:MAG: DUF1887 family protein [Clostridium butyricum]|nr:DUF1887 family protein [Clostridium butyricum]
MKNRTLINLFDIHNEGSLMAIDKYKPCKVIYIVEENNYRLYEQSKEYYETTFSKTVFESYRADNGDINKINNLIDNIDGELIINVTGGSRINSLILFNLAILKKCIIVYIDILSKEIYRFGKNISKVNEEFSDFYIGDILNTSGSELIMDSTNLSTNKDVVFITKRIYENLELWYKYKKVLYDSKVFVHDSFNEDKIIINLKSLKLDEIRLLKLCLEYLNRLKSIKYTENKDLIEVIFLNKYIKGFIFKSGTWLEVLTNIVINEIREIDEVKSGVVFLWKEQEGKIRNELDILAVKDSVLICISCKDSEKYDENALNELEVYSKRIGGSNTKKILVATKSPCKKCVYERAEAMGIHLVIVNPDINIFKKNLSNIINGKKQL